MTEERKQQLLYDIGEIAAGRQFEANETDIQVDIKVTPIAGSYDFAVDLCVYKITSDGRHAETMDVHHATSVAKIANATESQKEAVKQCLMNLITDSTRQLEDQFPGGAEGV